MSMLSSVSYLRFIIFAMLTYWLIKNQYLDFNLFFKIVLYSLTAILFFAYVELITGYNVILDDLKDIFQDPRPDFALNIDPWLQTETSFGFPSGHTQIAVVIWLYMT